MNKIENAFLVLAIFGAVAFAAFGMRSCAVNMEFDKQRTVECSRAGGVWLQTPNGSGCFTTIEMQP